MKENYSNKQKRIYEEYSLYSSDMLNGIMNNKKDQKGEVLRIIADILAERGGGFYTAKVEATEQEEIKEVIQPVVGEFQEDEGENVVYEEVPWLTKRSVFFPGLTEAAGDYVNGSENMMAEEDEEEGDYDDEEDINVEEAQEKYWKCPKCSELVEVEFDVCWNCQADMPKEIIHPNREEVIKEIRGNAGSFSTFRAGFGAIITGGIVILLDRHRNTIDDDFIRYIIGGFFVVAGLFLILFGIFRKRGGE